MQTNKDIAWMLKDLYDRRDTIPADIFNKTFHDKVALCIPIEKQIADYYASDGECSRHRVDRILAAAVLKKGERVLDLGCGIGTFTFNCAKHTGLCIGLDYSLESLKVAKKINQQFPDSSNGRRYFVCADAASLPFREGSFDKIISADFLEHLTKNQKKSIRQGIGYVLKQAGVFVAYTPNKIFVINQKLNEALRKIFFNDKVSMETVFLTASHIGEITPFQARKLCRDIGFRKINFFYKNNEFYLPFGNRFISRLNFLRVSFESAILKIPFLRDILSANILVVASNKRKCVKH